MKVVIGGVRLDTEKARLRWSLERIDENSNRISGDLYLSSRGTWYVHTPSQWADQRAWEILEPDEVLVQYAEYLSQGEIEEISDLARLTWE